MLILKPIYIFILRNVLMVSKTCIWHSLVVVFYERGLPFLKSLLLKPHMSTPLI